MGTKISEHIYSINPLVSHEKKSFFVYDVAIVFGYLTFIYIITYARGSPDPRVSVVTYCMVKIAGRVTPLHDKLAGR